MEFHVNLRKCAYILPSRRLELSGAVAWSGLSQYNDFSNVRPPKIVRTATWTFKAPTLKIQYRLYHPCTSKTKNGCTMCKNHAVYSQILHPIVVTPKHSWTTSVCRARTLQPARQQFVNVDGPKKCLSAGSCRQLRLGLEFDLGDYGLAFTDWVIGISACRADIGVF